MAKLSADIVNLTVCGLSTVTVVCCGVIETVCGPAVFDVIIDTGESRLSCGIMFSETVEFCPWCMTIEGSVVTLIGSGTLESKTPMLFSTHSVNQTLLWSTVKSNTCATPQSDKVPQSDQLGFLDGTRYSTSDCVDGSYAPRLFATCSLNHSLPLSSK